MRRYRSVASNDADRSGVDPHAALRSRLGTMPDGEVAFLLLGAHTRSRDLAIRAVAGDACATVEEALEIESVILSAVLARLAPDHFGTGFAMLDGREPFVEPPPIPETLVVA